jgi:hypothetical protein
MLISGIGTTFLAISKRDNHQNCYATRWFTIFYFPIFPLYRGKITPELRTPNMFEYKLVSKERLKIDEVLKTYLFGWILFPVLILWPIPLAISEVQTWLGIPHQFQIIGFIFSVLWVIIAVWKLKDWDEKRGF